MATIGAVWSVTGEAMTQDICTSWIETRHPNMAPWGVGCPARCANCQVWVYPALAIALHRCALPHELQADVFQGPLPQMHEFQGVLSTHTRCEVCGHYSSYALHDRRQQERIGQDEDILSPEQILAKVRKNLKTPECESIILWSSKVSGLISMPIQGVPNPYHRGHASDSWGIYPIGIMP